MKYIKHMCNCSDDAFLEQMEKDLGLEAYARWWKMLEVIGRAMEKDRNDPSAEHTVEKWCQYLKAKRKTLDIFLDYCRKKEKIYTEYSGNIVATLPECSGNVAGTFPQASNNILRIICPNIMKLRDEYSRKSGHRPDNPSEEKEEEIEKDLYKSSPLPPSKPPDPVDNFKAAGLRDLGKFTDAHDHLCALLGIQHMETSDQEFLCRWLEKYDMPRFAMPVLQRSLIAFRMKNGGCNPGNFAYFDKVLQAESLKFTQPFRGLFRKFSKGGTT